MTIFAWQTKSRMAGFLVIGLRANHRALLLPNWNWKKLLGLILRELVHCIENNTSESKPLQCALLDKQPFRLSYWQPAVSIWNIFKTSTVTNLNKNAQLIKHYRTKKDAKMRRSPQPTIWSTSSRQPWKAYLPSLTTSPRPWKWKQG